MGNKGFGQSQVPTRDVKRFMQSFKKCLAKAKGDRTQIDQFFDSNSARLNETFLEALPLVFDASLQGKLPEERFNTAIFFLNFCVYLLGFPRGDRSLNIEICLTCFQKSQDIITAKKYPEEWANTQMNLGIAYSDRIRGERAENIERAIDYYESALTIFSKADFPENWAKTQMNLGNAYWQSISSDREKNIEQAISFLKLAIQVFTENNFPENWAKSQMNLGVGFRDRIRGEKTENLEQAITYHHQASRVFTQQSYPSLWAKNESNLAQVFLERASLLDDLQDVEQAISLLQSSLEFSVKGSPEYIDTQYRLGTALSRRHEKTKSSEDLQQALRAYKLALNAISPEHYDRKKIWSALPATQAILGGRLVQEGEWQEGLQLLKNSVSQLSESQDHIIYAEALFQLGRAYEFFSDRENARLYYRDARRWFAHLNKPIGLAKSLKGLGSILISQGHFTRGIAELTKAKEIYTQLKDNNALAEIDTLYKIAQQSQTSHESEVYA